MTTRPRRMTPPVGGSQSSLSSWTDDLPVCRHSGIGFSNNQIYRHDGGRIEQHEFEDKFFHFRTEQDDYLYAIFDGYDGLAVPNFAHQRLPAELLLGQLIEVEDDAEVKRILLQSFVTVERGYFETLDHVLAERTNLKLSLPDGLTEYELFQKYPEEMEKMQSLEEAVGGGSSAIVALIHYNKLFVANVGDCRAVLCTLEPDNTTKVRQLSVDHTNQNDDELLRLAQLGIDTTNLQQHKLFGDKIATRTIGNYSVKGGYRDHALLGTARSEPITAEPDIVGGLPVLNITGFLLMFTNGLSQSLTQATGTTQANIDLAYMALAEFEVQATLSGVAQAVVDKVVRKHHDAYLSGNDHSTNCQKRDDITLIVRNFNFPLGTRLGSPTTTSQYNPASVPYSPHTPQRSQPRLILSPAGQGSPMPNMLTPVPSMTPLYVQVDNSHQGGAPGSPHGVFSDLTPQPNAQPYFPDESQHTPRPASQYSSNQSGQGEEEGTLNSGTSSSTSASTQSSGESQQRLFDFKGSSQNQAEPDENGMIDPYVDFTDFYRAYKAACQDASLT